jgi:hypothetical protein
LLSSLVFQSWTDEEGDDDIIAKRHLGSALNTRYGTWHYRPKDDRDLFGKRQNLQDIFNNLEPGIKEKRRIGAALNHRYGTSRYRLPGSEENEISESKRFLGPALDVRYRHFGSPFYRPAGSWDSMKRPFPKATRPLWSGRWKRSTDNAPLATNKDQDAPAENAAADKESVQMKLHHKGLRPKKLNRRGKEKRHLGAALGQGFGSFHVTKYRPSFFLKQNDAMDDRKAEARMIKLMG